MVKKCGFLIIVMTLLSFQLYAQDSTINQSVTTIKPKFKEGKAGFNTYIEKNLEIPEKAIRDSIEGEILVKFTIDREGNIVNPHIIKGINHGCDSALVSLIKKSPPWDPGTMNGVKANMSVLLPIVIKLPGKQEDIDGMKVNSFYGERNKLQSDGN